ncbi:hypothetical protein [Paenibacillus cremeus]|nr:hypothetical protein [Paenibacillus cremeus]
MFSYGQDIPLEDVVSDEAGEPNAGTPVAPAEFMFEYGKPIFADDSSI